MQQRSEETRARLLQAAEFTFAQCGYEGSGVAEICSAAGVSKGAFYHHFPSKQAVFLELLKSWLLNLEESLKDVHQEAGSVPQALVRMTDQMERVFQAADGRLPVFLEFWIQALRDPVFWQATIAPYQRFEKFFTGLVENGIEQGSVKPVDPAIASRVILALAGGVLLQSLLDPEGADWEQVAQQGIHYLINGIAEAKP